MMILDSGLLFWGHPVDFAMQNGWKKLKISANHYLKWTVRQWCQVL